MITMTLYFIMQDMLFKLKNFIISSFFLVKCYIIFNGCIVFDFNLDIVFLQCRLMTRSYHEPVFKLHFLTFSLRSHVRFLLFHFVIH